ncbi:MAG: adenosine deaminase [Lachnospiraceae bacterium]|nr:adenosine deaminase [Lachnospiraceae bacterium]
MDIDRIKCFAELHLHLDGSLSVAAVRGLCGYLMMEAPGEEEIHSKLSVSEGCRDLNEYLEKFAYPCSLLVTYEGIRFAVNNLLRELKGLGHMYAEIRFAPSKHVGKLSQEEVIRAAIEGLDDNILPAGLILCCMRGGERAENLETVRLAGKYLGRGVCALDLAGAEALFPANLYEEEFRLAKSLGVPFTIHAGEACGPKSIRAALDLGATRIGHGVRAIEDDELMRELADKKILLEFCPTSNLNTCVFKSYSEYPLRKFLRAGVPVCINTDNMAVSDTTLVREFKHLDESLGLSDGEIKTLLKNAAVYSFAPEDVKQRILGEIERL